MIKLAVRPRPVHRSPGTRLVLVLVATMASGAAGAALAQSSASYRLEESSLNNGGRPLGGATASSASYAISLDALGEAIASGPVGGAMYTVAGGFGASYPPAGEVLGLTFLDATTLMWLPEPSAWTYNLYRGAIADLLSGTYGSCQEQAIAGTSTTDNDAVAPGDGRFFHVSAINGLAEEGTIGFATSGIERIPALVCP